MAAAPDELSSHVTLPSKKQEELFSCCICQDRLEDPKDLECRHSFCKSCLDGILSFNEDGSASISCPMRCDSLTFVGKTGTTNDLKTSYSFKGIVSWLEEQDKASKNSGKQDNITCEEINCTNQITIFCSTCQLMMCQHCFTSHEVKCSCDHEYSLKFDRNTAAIMAVCKEHGTLTTSICSCQNKLICIYCMHRQHKNHRYSNIKNIAHQIRGKNKTAYDKWDDTSLKNKYSIQDTRQVTENAANEVRRTIMVSLATSTVKYMNKYFARLNHIHDQQISGYEEFIEEHLRNFSAYSEKENDEEFVDRPSFVLALNEQSIIGLSHGCTGKKSLVPSYNVRLSESTQENPFGKLNIDFLKDVPTNSCEPTVTSSIIKNENVNDEEEIFDIINQFHALCNRGNVCLARINQKTSNLNTDETIIDFAESSDADDSDSLQTCSNHPSAPPISDSLTITNSTSHVLTIKRGKRGFGFSIEESSLGPEVKFVRDDRRCFGLQIGDIIVRINNEGVRNLEFKQVTQLFKDCPVGQKATIEIQRYQFK